MSAVFNADSVGFKYPKSSGFACRNISFQVNAGECVALLGPNGAGKSTFLSMIGNLRQPTEGTLTIAKQSPTSPAARRNLGLTPQDSSFPKTVKVREVLSFVLAQYGRDLDQALVKALGLDELWDKLMNTLSGGQRRRVGLACALCGKPELIVLDEPATGLDLESRYSLYSYLKHLAKTENRAILFSSHHFDEIEHLADRVVVMGAGRIIRQGTLSEIKSQFGQRRIRFRAPGSIAVPSKWNCTVVNGRHEVLSAEPEEFVRWMVREELTFEALEVQAASLEEIFGQIMGATR